MVFWFFTFCFIRQVLFSFCVFVGSLLLGCWFLKPVVSNKLMRIYDLCFKLSHSKL